MIAVAETNRWRTLFDTSTLSLYFVHASVASLVKESGTEDVVIEVAE